MNTQLLKEKAKELYGNKYDLSKVEYINPKTRICITCPIHGDKFVFPYNFLRGRGCYECGREKVGDKLSMPTSTFIEKSNIIHNGKYFYEKTDLDNRDEKGRVIITCQKHGDFLQTPSKHLSGCGCQKCKSEKISEAFKMTTDCFIKKALKIHDGKYSYEKTDLDNRDEKGKVIITCPIHGDFLQTPSNHLRGQGCSKCNGNNKKTKEEFIEKAIKVHGDKYNYSKTDLDNRDEKGRVIITCPIHGDFLQMPASHLSGQGCKKCKIKVYDTKSFIEESVKKYGNLYNYDSVVYKDSHTKVLIRCNQCGEFFKQTPNDHLCGKGCSFCKESKLEKHIKVLLERHNIDYERQKTFDWLGLQRLDFYLPEYKIAIECQGIQHFKPVKKFGGKEGFARGVDLDRLKFNKCIENDVKIIYFTNLKGYLMFLGETLYKTDESIINLLENERKLL